MYLYVYLDLFVCVNILFLYTFYDSLANPMPCTYTQIFLDRTKVFICFAPLFLVRCSMYVDVLAPVRVGVGVVLA